MNKISINLFSLLSFIIIYIYLIKKNYLGRQDHFFIGIKKISIQYIQVKEFCKNNCCH